MTDSPVIRIRNLVKEYRGEGETVRVLDHLNMEVVRGSIVSVEGASGVGKSTLLHIMATVDSHTSGSVEVLGHKVTSMNVAEKERFRARALGFIFQHHYLLPDFTLVENVMMPMLIKGLSFREAARQANDMLGQVGLSHRSTHYPSQISGGEMARAGVARALVGGKELILADEPTGNLDKKNSDRLAELLWQLQQELQFTLLIVTHDRELAARVPIRYRLVGGILHQEGASS